MKLYTQNKSRTVELSRRSVARDLPFRKWRDMRERSALVICSMTLASDYGIHKMIFYVNPF